MDFDVAIIGAGPAGLACGLYLARAGFRTALFERLFAGGQAATTDVIENYPAVPNVNGADLAMRMADQAAAFGCEARYEDVTGLVLAGEEKRVVTASGAYTARAVVLAMGAQPRLLGAPGEVRLRGRGVSYCATCDGAFFKGRDVAVVGGGDTALEDALYMARFAHSVTLIHRRDEFRACPCLVTRARAVPNIGYRMSAQVTAVNGDATVEGATVKDLKTGDVSQLAVQGLFVAVGTKPNSELAAGQVELDPTGYVVAGEDGRTSEARVYAVGDLRTKPLRQVITAAADGASASYSIQHDLA